jgi:predicted  nucleic acid-binding Zn-ribbon protein
MLQKPEALQLADWLEYGNYNHEDVIKAAAELRRLHSEVDRLTRHILNQNNELDDLIPMAEKVETQRDELLEALKWIARVNAMDYEYQAKARAAIAKAENNK